MDLIKSIPAKEPNTCINYTLEKFYPGSYQFSFTNFFFSEYNFLSAYKWKIENSICRSSCN